MDNEKANVILTIIIRVCKALKFIFSGKHTKNKEEKN